MVTSPARQPKVDRIPCAIAFPLSDTPEFKSWDANKEDKAKRRALEDLFKNNRSGKGISRERFHFLPGVCEIPDMVLDFQAVEPRELVKVRALPCLGTLASPFAEALLVRYTRYTGRLGTRDLAVDVLLARLGAQPEG
jgi:hypothetical protein